MPASVCFLRAVFHNRSYIMIAINRPDLEYQFSTALYYIPILNALF